MTSRTVRSETYGKRKRNGYPILFEYDSGKEFGDSSDTVVRQGRLAEQSEFRPFETVRAYSFFSEIPLKGRAHLDKRRVSRLHSKGVVHVAQMVDVHYSGGYELRRFQIFHEFRAVRQAGGYVDFRIYELYVKPAEFLQFGNVVSDDLAKNRLA